jgi:hypothetical protein
MGRTTAICAAVLALACVVLVAEVIFFVNLFLPKELSTLGTFAGHAR